MFPDRLSSLSVPLILDKELEEVEANHVDHSTITVSFFNTCLHGLNALSGVGILSIPYAFASGGWLSLIILFIIATTTFYSSLLIQKCMDMDPNIRTYPDIGFCAFGKKGRLLVSIFMNLELYLVATGFLILEGDNLQNLFPDVGSKIMGLKLGGRQMFIIIVALIILPSVWLDNMNILSYISASGVLASAIILGSVFWLGAFEGIGFEHKGTMINWKGIPTSISLYAFCYCAHPVFPDLYTSMKNKRQFSNVMLVVFTLCTLIYASMAIFGYLMFGSEVQTHITLSLPTHKLSSKIAIYTTLVNPISKYALMVTPITNAIRSRFQDLYNKRILGVFIGTILVMSTVIIALAVPFFGDLMSLVGAFLSVTVSIILPCLCYLKISDKYKRFGFESLVLVGVILMGIVVMIIGTYTSVLEILDHM